tara:strand:+ start:5958 stop:6803 length:846 start_codon:yes stop_codon:yes gene_type:complete
MKILVTGGAGFIGTNLIKKLLSEGHDVQSLDDYKTGLISNHQDDCFYMADDIENIGEMAKDFDIIYHLAALAHIQESFNNPQENFRVNTVGTQKVCEFARLTGAKLVYAGSASRWCDPHTSPYSTSKFLGEEIIKMYRKSYGLNMEIARFYNVYGKGEKVDGRETSVIGIWRHNIQNNIPLTIVGDGNQKRDFTHVEDIVDGLWRIGVKNLKHDDAWELGTGISYSVNDLFDMFNERFSTQRMHIEDQQGNVRESLRENDDSIKKLGWNPTDKLKNYISSL